MKDSLFNDLLESIKSLPTNVLKEMEANMEQEQMREEFEQWYTSYDIRTPQDPFEKEVAWTAWKASREHLVVELPEEVPVTGHDWPSKLYNLAIQHTKHKINKQGIKSA